MNKRTHATWLVALAALAAMAHRAPAAEAPAATPFAADCQALAQADHRLTGTPEYRAAADHVEARLRTLGADEVLVQHFRAAQTQVRRCELRLAAGVTRPLLPMRPNGIVAPVTPPEGITGPLRHFRKGELGDPKSQRSPRGAIAVLDYNDGLGWLRAFRLGAKAVLFVREDAAQAWQPHHTVANANLLRFFYRGPRAHLPEGATATVHSEVVWSTVVGRNVYAFFRGTRPRFEQDSDELLVVAANLDSFGEVPRLAPGARAAANCGGLLHLAQHLKAHRPRRHVLLAFFDAQCRGHAGVAAFYRALEDEDYVRIQDREVYQKTEREFLAQIADLLAKDRPLEEDSPARRELVNRMKSKGKAHAYDVGDQLYELRVELSRLAKDDAAAAPRIAQLQEREAALQAEKDRWNDLRRALARERLTNHVEAERAQALDEVRLDVQRRAEELAFETQALEHDRRLKEVIGKFWISLHVSLLLGDATPRWGLIIGGDSSLHASADNPGLYGRVQGTFLSAYKALGGEDAVNFEPASADGTLDPPRLLWAAPYLVHSGEVAGKLGIYNVALATAQEPLAHEGTPDDTLARLDLPRMEQQFAGAARMLAAVASEPGLSLRRAIEQQKLYVVTEFGTDNRPHGPTAMGRSFGSAVQDRPMRGATVQLTVRYRSLGDYNRIPFRPTKMYAFDDFLVLRTDQNGCYSYGPVQHWRTHHTGFAIDTDARGVITSASDLKTLVTPDNRLDMFDCRHGCLVLPPLLSHRPASLLRARSNSPLDNTKANYETRDGVVAWFIEKKIEGVKVFNLQAMVGLVSGRDSLAGLADRDMPYGLGYPATDAWTPPSTTHRAATDLWRLNEMRIQMMRDRGLMNSSVEELHGHTEDLLIAAEKAPSVAGREALAASAFMAGRPVYESVRANLDDLVRAVLVLLALSVPFSFALERLLIGSTSIYRQILWFAGFFILTFFILFVTHPAFAVSKTPVIIFLGFAVVVLSSLVIVIIMRKFEVELKVLQGLTSTVHLADVSRFSTIMAAMSMGISTMRRRPLRTALTATTIIMLTFTILCFASFGIETGIVKLFSEASPGYSGAYLHKVNWATINPDILDVVEGRWGGTHAICRRYWRAPRTPQQKGPLLTRHDGVQPLAITGVLGIEAAEMKQRPDLAAVLPIDPATFADTVLMTRAVASHLGVEAGDTVLVGGLRLRVGKLLEPSRVGAARDMDGSGILPVDFVEMSSALGDAATPEQALAMQSQENWAYLPTDSVVIVSAENAQAMGAALHAITLYARDAREATDLAEDLARIVPIPVAATRADGVYRHVLGTVVEASGAGDLLFPILLGGLVIFGTMLGSVADREKEIYTFSSLGLAPPHVASLFFAEALVYSVIGGLAGYLLAEGTLTLLGHLAQYGLVRVPEMNYSSTNAIVTILIVMATVLVSAIYPAIKASRSANPGILRTWRLPAPDGDVLDLTFPFTVSEYDITGVVSFLKEHFENFGDTGLGVFMASDPRLVRAANGTLGLNALVSLAPFDLGVTQNFELRSAASEIPGIDEVKITLTRRSGQPKDWRRLNKVLLDDLRRQFLIWRALPNETMEVYRHRTLAEMGAPQDNA
ncbi:FtsX-like permease family protein [bacterium]|nr:FtsX-like permease family protein [bacterium]